MARNFHKSLDWEKEEIEVSKYYLSVLSDFRYFLDDQFGTERASDMSWTWMGGIVITAATKQEYLTIRKFLTEVHGLKKLDKSSTESGLQLKGRFGANTHLKRRSTTYLNIKFKWGLPDSCEVVYIQKERTINDINYFVDSDGQIRERYHETEINCDKPVLESVFADG